MEVKIIKWIMSQLFFFVLISFSLLQGCASSDLSRNSEGEVDTVYSDVKTSVSNLGKGDIADSYQNTSQTTKGVILGGITGAIVGSAIINVGALGGAAVGAILLGSLGAYIDSHTTLVDKLRNRGIKVFILGDQVLIVLPSSRTFYTNTANIIYAEDSTMDLVAKLIGSYANIAVKVSGYTDDTGAPLVDQSLSRQQAVNVAKSLWRHGVNTRLLYAEGYGGTHLVSKNTCDWSSDNYRVEITMEKLPV
jgi:outer membrane protein OmpA-like peptidoglycan-associated protein